MNIGLKWVKKKETAIAKRITFQTKAKMTIYQFIIR